MRNRRKNQNLRVTWLLTLLTAFSLALPLSTLVQAQRNYRVSERQIEQLLTRIEARSNAFRNSFADSLSSTRNNNIRRSAATDASNQFVNAANRLPERFRSNNLNTGDVQDLLNRANQLNSATRGLWLSSSAQNDWRMLRSDLATLANYYNLRWNEVGVNNTYYTPQRRGSNWLTGTWRLDTSRSDNVETVVDRETRGLPGNNPERARMMLQRRLEAPDTLALDRQGRQITLASTRAPQVNFSADGVTRTETNPNGRSVRVRAYLSGQQLTVSTVGDRGNDYNVTFVPIDNGQRMRVTRSVYTDRLNRPVTVSSVYERTSDTAQMNLYTGRGNDDRNANNNSYWGRRGRSGSFYVPDGTLMTAELSTSLDTHNVRDGDRFTMTVTSPRQYDGAVIEGHVVQAERSGRVTGRAELGMDFDRIRLRNGQTYEFAGYLETIRTPGGDNIRVDNEGSVKDDDSQTNRTITRSGIGAALGAVIGAIAGGGSGAAIGAAIGAGAGAGSVFIQGREDLELPVGTQVTLRASTPRNAEARR